MTANRCHPGLAHQVAIANSRLIALDEQSVTFQWKDYRTKGRYRYKTMACADTPRLWGQASYKP